MSNIFGICAPEGDCVEPGELRLLSELTGFYAVDGTFLSTYGRIGMGFQPLHTHSRLRLEAQPTIDGQGNVLVMDGRIDNFEELSALLELQPNDFSDSQIVLRSFARWNEGCFSRLIGDWALALWCPSEQVLYLARDHAGARTLYFRQMGGSIVWATRLESFAHEGRVGSLDLRYAFCYLACRPIRELTPYEGIEAIAPAHYYAFRGQQISQHPHWRWMVHGTGRYQKPAEYQEEFLFRFRRAVERRTGDEAPIVAELSGGMDSTSIVCMSDLLVREAGNGRDKLAETVSYYDETEPGWNEAPYFSVTEALRGKPGIHVKSSFADRAFEYPTADSRPQLLPGADKAHLNRAIQLIRFMDMRGSRVILSGMGGDDLLGGIPSYASELIEYLAAGRLVSFIRQGLRWGLAENTPIFQVFFRTLQALTRLYMRFPTYAIPYPVWVNKSDLGPASGPRAWVDSQSLSRFCHPRALENGSAWRAILETLPHLGPSYLRQYEYRYPFLDRDLVDFLFRVPRRELAKPGRRRYMMREALRGIVPEQILERRRKAYCARGPIAILRDKHDKIAEVMDGSVLEERGFIHLASFREALRSAVKDGDPALAFPIMRTVDFELWLRESQKRGLVA